MACTAFVAETMGMLCTHLLFVAALERTQATEWLLLCEIEERQRIDTYHDLVWCSWCRTLLDSVGDGLHAAQEQARSFLAKEQESQQEALFQVRCRVSLHGNPCATIAEPPRDAHVVWAQGRMHPPSRPSCAMPLFVSCATIRAA